MSGKITDPERGRLVVCGSSLPTSRSHPRRCQTALHIDHRDIYWRYESVYGEYVEKLLDIGR
jgi:hypothetical protein